MKAPIGYQYLTHDPQSGVWHWFKYDEVTGQQSVCTTQDPTAILDVAQEQSYNAKGTLGKANLVKVATIPEGLRQKTMNEEGWDPYRQEHTDRLFRKLMGDWAYLRIAEGFSL
mgnify:CR=1 FL=1